MDRTVAGYSQTPLFKKLGYKDGQRALFIAVPDSLRPVFAEAPCAAGAEWIDALSDTETATGRPWDVIHAFASEAADLDPAWPHLRAQLHDRGLLWLSWPKKAAKVPTTLDENVVRRGGLAAGLVDIKVCAVDGIWSGLKFVVPVKARR